MGKRSNDVRSTSNGRSAEVAALLTAARAVLEQRAFTDAASAILMASRALLGAGAGVIAVSAADGADLEIACLAPGNVGLDAAADLPLPLRRVCDRAARDGRVVIAADLADGAAQAAEGEARPALDNALVAPIVIAGAVAGILGLVNRPNGFAAAESQLAEVFAEMAAVAMLNSRTINGLERSHLGLEQEVREGARQLRQAEEHLATLVENLPDVVARFDRELRHLYVNQAAETMAGRPRQDFVGKTNRELGMPVELVESWDGALRGVFATGQAASLEFSFPVADGVRRFDCRLVPEIAPTGDITSVLSVARDVTERWRAYEAEQRARTVAEALREATVALTRSLDRETVLATLLNHLRRMVGFDRASVMLLEETSRVSVRAVFDGDQVVPLAPALRAEFDPAEHPIVADILKTGTTVRISDLRTHPGWSLPSDRSSEVSWMGVPLFARGSVAGLFSLSKGEPGYFNDDHMRLAEALSSQASVAVENAVLFEQMQASTGRMQALSRRLVAAQENERRSIARELHDEAGQALASLRIGLRLLEKEIEEGASVSGRVAELMHRTDTVIDGLHRLAADLRPASLEHQGLEPALRQYTRSAAAELGLTVRFKARGFGAERLPSMVETALFRVVQEAMTNIVRHAGATQVDVLAEHRGDRVMVMVEDNGVGFDPRMVRRGDQLGLLGLLERAEALGGTLTVESEPGAGTTVVVEVASADPNPAR